MRVNRSVWMVGAALPLGAGLIAFGASAPKAVQSPDKERQANAATAQDTRAHVVDAKSIGVGSKIPFIPMIDLNGKTVMLTTRGGGPATVLALTSTTCPVCLKQLPTLAAIEKEFASKGVRFVFINPSGSESKEAMKAAIARNGLKGPYVVDAKGELTHKLGARTTTEVWVLDKDLRISYRGAVDDQYGVGFSIEKPKNNYLRDALGAVLAGQAPKVAATWAPGCALQPIGENTSRLAPTYYAHVAPIVQRACVDCHREGGVAPFRLDRYQDFKDRPDMIRYVIDRGIMPPWFAVKGPHEDPDKWKNDRSLSDSEKSTIKAWLDAKLPLGDPKAAPAPPKYDSDWQIGSPDVVFKLQQPTEVKATGVMPYVYRVVPTGFTEDKWVQKIEVRPGVRSVVHHILVFVVPNSELGSTRGGDGEGLTGFFGEYVPGQQALVYEDGFAKKIPAGSSLRFQIHYTPNGTAAVDTSEIGLIFSKQPPKHEVHTFGIVNIGIKIPAGEGNHAEKASIQLPSDVALLSFLPHMHLRGKAAKYEWVKPEGDRQTLLDVPRYDFNWQLNYVLNKPMLLPKGSSIEYTAWYDNSTNNPANPDPTKTVRWGDQTFNEMMLGYVEYYVPDEKPGAAKPGIAGPGGAAVVESIFKRLDRNSDGFVTEEEAGAFWSQIKAADANGDGKISLQEALDHFGKGGRRRRF